MLVSFWDIVNGVFGYLFALLTGNVDGWLTEQCVEFVKQNFPGI